MSEDGHSRRPLPRDVSPLMREENFGLPTVQPDTINN
jgi:hypothetical protein